MRSKLIIEVYRVDGNIISFLIEMILNLSKIKKLIF